MFMSLIVGCLLCQSEWRQSEMKSLPMDNRSLGIAAVSRTGRFWAMDVCRRMEAAPSECQLILYDQKEGQYTSLTRTQFTPPNVSMLGIEFSDDERRVFALLPDRIVGFEIPSGKQVLNFQIQRLSEREEQNVPLGIAALGNDRLILAGLWQDRVRHKDEERIDVIDVETGTPETKHRQRTNFDLKNDPSYLMQMPVAASRDGKRIAIAYRIPCKIEIRDERFALKHSISIEEKDADFKNLNVAIDRLFFSGDGQSLFVTTENTLFAISCRDGDIRRRANLSDFPGTVHTAHSFGERIFLTVNNVDKRKYSVLSGRVDDLSRKGPGGLTPLLSLPAVPYLSGDGNTAYYRSSEGKLFHLSGNSP